MRQSHVPQRRWRRWRRCELSADGDELQRARRRWADVLQLIMVAHGSWPARQAPGQGAPPRPCVDYQLLATSSSTCCCFIGVRSSVPHNRKGLCDCKKAFPNGDARR
jgi:hypothetical protein